VLGWKGNAVNVRELKNAYIILAENLKGRDQLRVLSF
jgi:hypothetical protein